MTDTPDAWTLTVSDAASILGASADAVRDWADAGTLPCWTTPGGHRRFRRSDVLALLPDAGKPQDAA